MDLYLSQNEMFALMSTNLHHKKQEQRKLLEVYRLLDSSNICIRQVYENDRYEQEKYNRSVNYRVSRACLSNEILSLATSLKPNSATD